MIILVKYVIDPSLIVKKAKDPTKERQKRRSERSGRRWFLNSEGIKRCCHEEIRGTTKYDKA